MNFGTITKALQGAGKVASEHPYATGAVIGGGAGYAMGNEIGKTNGLDAIMKANIPAELKDQMLKQYMVEKQGIPADSVDVMLKYIKNY